MVLDGTNNFPCRFGKRFSFLVALLCFFLGVTVAVWAAPQHVSWHHGRSPYRAEFELLGKPSHPKAGMAVSVPVCGLGPVDGKDFFAFDQNGAQLAVMPLGKSARNEAIALVAPRSGSKRVFVYFGSKTRAPRHKGVFLPGLTVDVRTLPEGPSANWKQVEQLLGKSQRLGRVFVDKIELAYNPVDSSDSCILVFQGYLDVKKAGKQTLMLISDDAGYVFVDDKLLLSRDGRHWARDAQRGECRATVDLTPRPHLIRCVIVDFGGGLMGVVGRWLDGHHKHVLRKQDFLQPGAARFVTVEGRYHDSALPAFWYKSLSYMSYKGAQYTEVQLGTYNKARARWRFADGSEFVGETVRKVVVGLQSLPLTVVQKKVQAKGMVALSEIPPKQLKMTSDVDFKRYAAMMLKQNLNAMTVSTLRGYITFLGYRELNEDIIPFAEAILANASVSDKNRRQALQELACASARNFPKKADKAYALLLREQTSKAELASLAREYAEFVIFRQRDLAKAEKVIRRIEQKLGAHAKQAVSLRLDLALQKGEVEEAKKQLDRLLSSREFGEKQRYAAVKGNVLRQRFQELLTAGFILEARETLHEWEEISPNDRMNGSLSLARSHMWQALGWLDGALGELDGVMLLDSLLPNLPDVELERGVVFQKAGDNRKANDIFLKIVKRYPNHPAAARAKELVK